MHDDRFEHLRFPVHKFKPDHDLSKEARFRVLFNYPEFSKFGKDNPEKSEYRNKLIRYICFLYDPNCELQDEYPNLTERKEAAAIEAGFERNKNEEWPELVSGFFSFEDDEVVDMILRFLKIFKSPLWTEICTQEHELEKYTKMRWVESDGKAQSLMKVCNSIREQLDENRKEFFQGDKGLEKKILEMVTPENVMRLFEEELANVSEN